MGKFKQKKSSKIKFLKFKMTSLLPIKITKKGLEVALLYVVLVV